MKQLAIFFSLNYKEIGLFLEYNIKNKFFLIKMYFLYFLIILVVQNLA